MVKDQRKIKEKSLIQWINTNNPDSLDILRKIGEVSSSYEEILNLICAELEKIPVHQRNEFSMEKEKQEIKNLKVEQNSLGLSLEALETKRDHLEKDIQELESQLASLTNEANHYNDILQQLSFNTSEDYQMILLKADFERIKEEKVSKSLLASKRTDVMGQNRHLWDRKKHLLQLIEEERAQQLQYINQRATQHILKNSKVKPENNLSIEDQFDIDQYHGDSI